MYSSIGEGPPSDAGGPRFDPQCLLFHQIHAIYKVYCDMQLTRCSHNVVYYMTLGFGVRQEPAKNRNLPKVGEGDSAASIYIYIYIYTHVYIYIYIYIC